MFIGQVVREHRLLGKAAAHHNIALRLALSKCLARVNSLGRDRNMNIKQVRTLLGWCTILNGALLIISALMIRFAGDCVLEVQRQWVPLTADAVHLALYLFLGFYKIIVIAFNLVPYLALVIIDRSQGADAQ